MIELLGLRTAAQEPFSRPRWLAYVLVRPRRLRARRSPLRASQRARWEGAARRANVAITMNTAAGLVRTLELLLEILRPLPLTAPEIDGEVRFRWHTGVWDEDGYTIPLTIPKPDQSRGYGRLYECLDALKKAGRVECFTGPDLADADRFEPLWRSL